MRTPKVLFVIPCGDYLPGGTVRVLTFLPFLDRLRIRHRVLSYFSPRVDRFDARVRAGGAPRVVRSVLLFGAAFARFMYMWSTRVQLLRLAPRVDMVYIAGVLPPAWLMRALCRRNPRTVVDLDDAIFLGNPARGRAVLSLASQVVAGSHFILDYARALNPNAVLVPSSVSIDQHDSARSHASGTGSGICIGWLGSPFTVKYLRHLVEPLQQLAAEGHRIELRVDGASAAAVPAIRGVTVRATPSYTEADIPSLVREYDIGVMPIDDGPWEQAKCAMKALIYMAASRPAVCSRVGENVFVIEDGVNGFLAESSAEWTAKLRALIVDQALRQKMGRLGRQTVEARYSSVVAFSLLETRVFAPAGLTTAAAGAGR